MENNIREKENNMTHSNIVEHEITDNMERQITANTNNAGSNIKPRKSTARRLRSVFVVAFILLAVTGTTVYAWFTVTNQAQVSSLTLQAGTSGGLKIGKSANDCKHTSIELVTTSNKVNYCVRPITSVDGVKFFKPVYAANGVVSGVEDTSSDVATISNKSEADGGYMLSYTVYLLAEAKNLKGNVGIRLASDKVDANSKGTYVQAGDNDSTGAHMAIRMSFTANDTTSVYEPNANSSVKGADTDQYSQSAWGQLKTIKQTSDSSGLFAKEKALPNAVVSYKETTSPELFKIKANTVTPVKINIWLEGADKDCVNDIIAENLKANIQFVCTELE